MVDSILDRIAFLCAGNHPKGSVVRTNIVALLERIRDDRRVSTRELATSIKLNLDIPAERAKFYRALSPLNGKNCLRLKFIISNRDQATQQVYYEFSPDLFRGTFAYLAGDIKSLLSHHGQRSH